MTAYYNEIDPYAAQWLRNLIAAGHIAPGVVDERDIRDVLPSELTGYTQCHFFAGIGGWSYALRLAGWTDDRPVWTGSCPCQPFSAAGRRDGVADERHLWPHWFWIIGECHPSTIFGEQVAIEDGRKWFATVQADLEGVGYVVGRADLCAAGVGAPQIRQRLGFVADAKRAGLEERREQQARDQRAAPERDGPLGRPWSDAEWLAFTDECRRPVERGSFPLDHGVSARVDKLRAFGNAIVPQVFAEFIAASREALGEDGVVTLRQMLG